MNKDVLQAKKETVQEISAGLKKSESLTIVGYQGLTVVELIDLRRALAKSQAHLGVYKNTLIKRALADNGIVGLDDVLQGPNAVVFSETVNLGPKAVSAFARDHGKLVIRGGIVGNQKADAATMKQIAKLPDKNGMISMLLQCLQAPLTTLALTIKAIGENQPAQQPAAEAAVAAPQA